MASKVPAFGTINLDSIGIKSNVQTRVEFRLADPRPVVAKVAIVRQASRGSSALSLNLSLVMDESINTT
jgi:hypothetical protein